MSISCDYRKDNALSTVVTGNMGLFRIMHEGIMGEAKEAENSAYFVLRQEQVLGCGAGEGLDYCCGRFR